MKTRYTSKTYGFREMELRGRSKLLDYVRRKLWDQMDEVVDELTDWEEFLINHNISTWFLKDRTEMSIELLFQEWTILYENFSTQVRIARERHDINMMNYEDLLCVEDLMLELLSDLEDLGSEKVYLGV